MKTLLVFGLGYSAEVLARRLAGEGWTVTGTGHTPASLERIDAAGVRPLFYERGGEAAGMAETIAEAIAGASRILVSIPPGPEGDAVLARYAGELAAAPHLRWIGYLSTVGVYGDHGGAWVDEDTPPCPISERSRERLRAEDAWRGFARDTGRVVHIFRLAGIYGPGHNPLERLLAGDKQCIEKPGQVFNRIHVDDIAATVAAAMARAGAALPDVYNVTDDEPAPPQDVTAFAARLLGQEPPPLVPFSEAVLSPMARSFYGENKRVRNGRIKRELGVRLRFPTYREGLAAIAAGVSGGGKNIFAPGDFG